MQYTGRPTFEANLPEKHKSNFVCKDIVTLLGYNIHYQLHDKNQDILSVVEKSGLTYRQHLSLLVAAAC